MAFHWQQHLTSPSSLHFQCTSAPPGLSWGARVAYFTFLNSLILLQSPNDQVQRASLSITCTLHSFEAVPTESGSLEYSSFSIKYWYLCHGPCRALSRVFHRLTQSRRQVGIASPKPFSVQDTSKSAKHFWLKGIPSHRLWKQFRLWQKAGGKCIFIIILLGIFEEY